MLYIRAIAALYNHTHTLNKRPMCECFCMHWPMMHRALSITGACCRSMYSDRHQTLCARCRCAAAAAVVFDVVVTVTVVCTTTLRTCIRLHVRRQRRHISTPMTTTLTPQPPMSDRRWQPFKSDIIIAHASRGWATVLCSPLDRCLCA